MKGPINSDQYVILKKIGYGKTRNPLIFGELCWDRTDNLLIKSQLLPR
mgnify:CR=1 FL=1